MQYGMTVTYILKEIISIMYHLTMEQSGLKPMFTC